MTQSRSVNTFLHRNWQAPQRCKPYCPLGRCAFRPFAAAWQWTLLIDPVSPPVAMSHWSFYLCFSWPRRSVSLLVWQSSLQQPVRPPLHPKTFAARHSKRSTIGLQLQVQRSPMALTRSLVRWLQAPARQLRRLLLDAIALTSPAPPLLPQLDPARQLQRLLLFAHALIVSVAQMSTAQPHHQLSLVLCCLHCAVLPAPHHHLSGNIEMLALPWLDVATRVSVTTNASISNLSQNGYGLLIIISLETSRCSRSQ